VRGVRETIAVTPAGVRAAAADVRRLSGELREAAGAAGAGACQVSAALTGAADGFDAMWLAWSTALDQVAEALASHARALDAAADGYAEADTAAIPDAPAGP
jgi:WXG100 family type VII secretion target